MPGLPAEFSETSKASPHSGTYHFAWNIIPILAGLIDLPLGVLGKIAALFWQPELPAKADTPRRRRRGLALVLGGIEGPSFYNYSIAMGLLRGRFRGAVARMHWNAGPFGLRSVVNLMSRSHHERQSDLLAKTIVDHVRTQPDSPMSLVAQSGGCYIVLRALEKLPADIEVDVAVLLAPAVSPAFDVTRAAAKCRRGLVSVGSLGDFFFLGLGTLLLGTSDRKFSPSAGFVGWHYHTPNFTECRWHPSWTKLGYIGNHIATSAPAFVSRVVAQWCKRSGT